jgi:hypothetical protein
MMLIPGGMQFPLVDTPSTPKLALRFCWRAIISTRQVQPINRKIDLLTGIHFTIQSIQVTTPVLSGGTGQAFAPVTSAQAAQCQSLLGRNCVVNVA